MTEAGALGAMPFDDPNRVGHSNSSDDAPAESVGTGADGPASVRIVVGFGFWVYLLGDIILFSAFFAAYAVLSGATAGGPTGRELFDLNNVAIETALLLASSFTCGMASIAANERNQLLTQAALLVTGLLGAAFVVMEVREFADLIDRGAGPQRSAFLSSFFGVVGLHGVHVTVGLLWLATTMAQLAAKGFRDDIMRRLLCFTLFWHALDIVWVALITNVYLMGFA